MNLALRTPNPEVLGAAECRATLYWPHADAEVPVIVGYDIDGYKDVIVRSVHNDYGRNEWSEDFLADLDETQVADLVHHICLTVVEWRKPCGRTASGDLQFRGR